MTIKKRIASIILLLALMITLGGELLSAFVIKASAEGAVSHSNVLDDLERDESFNPEDYPADANDYSLQVIQVAEGSNGELFVYVYQPSDAVKDFRASKINMALQAPEDKSIMYSLYNLTWLNSNGVFDKYVVDGLTVSDEAYRYYTIASIYRAFDENIDSDFTGEDDITNYKGYKVAKSWRSYFYNGIYHIESSNINYVEATIHSVGLTRYYDGWELFQGSKYCDSHFVAFSIDNFEAKWIYNADIAFWQADYELVVNEYTFENETYIDSYPISDSDYGQNTGTGWFNKEYKWNRISTLEEFINDVEDHTNEFISEDYKKNLSKAQFVFRFKESAFSGVDHTNDGDFEICKGTLVKEVTLLRFEFLTENGVYNLGVVSDIVSDDGASDFEVTIADNIKNGFEDLTAILIIAVVVFIFVFLWGDFIKPFLKWAWNGIKYLFNLLIDIITFPFRLIKWLFGK